MGEPLRPGEVRTGEDYETSRAAERRAAAEAQRERRVRLGERLTLVFESRETIRLSLEELLRAERIRDAGQVSAKIDDFNVFVPQPGHLGATLYVEASDAAELGTALADLEGVQRAVYLEVAGRRYAGNTLQGEPADDLAAASFIAFPLPADASDAWRGGAGVVAGVAHPSCSERAELTTAQRSAIGADL